MLKFQDDYTTLIATFEDFILLVYTIIDDLYQQFVPASVSQRRNVDAAKMSDSEIGRGFSCTGFPGRGHRQGMGSARCLRAICWKECAIV